MKLHAILALNLIIVWTTAGTDVKDSLTLRVFNKKLSLSDAEIHKMLNKANLEGHGYEKEVTTTVKRRPGSSVPDVIKTHYYYKVVPCDGVMEIEKELDKLLKGFLGRSVAQKLKKDVKEMKIKSGKLCKAGVEIHFREEQSCLKNGKRVKRAEAPAPASPGCNTCYGVCISVRMMN